MYVMAMALLKYKTKKILEISTFTNAGNVIQKESFMYMNPRWLQVMMLITVMIILTTSCTKADYDFNPWTTVMKAIAKNEQ